MNSIIGNKKTFQKRPGTTHIGDKYEDLVTALLGLKLAKDDQVEDFLLSSNNKDFGSFDDVVVEVFYKNKSTAHYAVQLKHKDKQGKKITRDMLAATEGDFSLQHYFNSFKEIRETCGNNNFCFVLYTNAACNKFPNFKLQHKDYFVVEMSKCPLNSEDIFNTSDKDFVYQFKIHPVIDNDSTIKQETDDYSDFLKHFFFYSDQKNLDSIETATSQLLQSVYCSKQTSFKKYSDFISSWSKHKGKKDYLDKKNH